MARDNNVINISNLRIAKDFKYTALYWALGFIETSKDVFEKDYGDKSILISCSEAKAYIKGITIINGKALSLDKADSFVVLEFLDYIFANKVDTSTLVLDLDNEFNIYIDDIYISCQDYDQLKPRELPHGKFKSVLYQSKLYSGLIERKIYLNNELTTIAFDNGNISFKKSNPRSFKENGFTIINDVAVSYEGDEERPVVPQGVKRLASGIFWDYQNIKEVILPEGLISLGGDTFYLCSSLEKIVIPSSVEVMGDNPFAGCPKLTLINYSKHFIYDENGLRNLNGKYIYFPIKSSKKEIEIPDDTRIIGKHAFYSCSNLEKITIPSSVIHIQNFPFSDCGDFTLINHSPAYQVENKVVYTKDKDELIGVIQGAKIDCLSLPEGLKSIRRNSFYKCSGIKKIIFPSTLEKIGYNPFVGCDMEFVSNSLSFKVVDGILYNADLSKLICCPNSKAISEFKMPESVIELERGAFSGCNKLTSISLKNVSLIGKSCFTHCSSLETIYLSDLVSYVGEWAFAHSTNLKTVSVYKNTIIDKNAFENTSAKLLIREERSNYIIESDNIYTLRSLTRTLSGQIDSIVIDPPYNSKISYVGYKDYFLNNDYLTFMRERLTLAHKLLSNNGHLVLNIDKGTFKDLYKLIKEIFGKKNVFFRLWKTRNKKHDKNRKLNTKKKKRTTYEYIIFARKDKTAKLNRIKNGDNKESKRIPLIFDGYGTNSSAKDELAIDLGERGLFQTPKPTKLIKEFIRATSNKDSLVLDFFAGSGTVGKAVNELNKEDGGNRKYILVSNSESDICNKITRRRLNDSHINL